MKEYDLKNFETFDIDRDLNDLPGIFDRDQNTLLYVVDSDQKLYGSITWPDVIKKIVRAKSVRDVMDENYERCVYNPGAGGYAQIFDTAKIAFDQKPDLAQIAVVDADNTLLFSIKRDFCPLNLYGVFLTLKEKEAHLSAFFHSIHVQSIGFVGYDPFVLVVGELLEKYVQVKFYDRERYDMEKNEDLIIFSDFGSAECRQLYLNGAFVSNVYFFHAAAQWMNPDNTEKLHRLQEAADEILYFRIPQSYEVKNPSQLELDHMSHIGNTAHEIVNAGVMRNEYDKENYTAQLVNNLFSYKDADENVRLKDCDSKYFHIINGRRLTTDHTKRYEHTLFVLGNSIALGAGNEDKYTIPSIMQRIFNNLDLGYEIVNMGGVGEFLAFVCDDFFRRVKKGDKIIILDGDISGVLHKRIFARYANLKCRDLTHLFDRPHNMGDVFFDLGHINRFGSQRAAEEITRIILENPDCGSIIQDGADWYARKKNDSVNTDGMEEEIQAYLESIMRAKVDSEDIGAIVMNCNPFTNGHRYLIECAAKQVSHLYVFIVEEDKSRFKFKDRYTLVREGTADLNNVTVLPSGKFIVSSRTFTEYFNKEQLQDVQVNPAMDVEIFSKYIAPALHIQKRFAGSEPNCYITNQYNKAMKEILPKYNIQFIEIPRMEHNAAPVSASTVRDLLKKKDFDAIKELVPAVTYRFLMGLEL